MNAEIPTYKKLKRGRFLISNNSTDNQLSSPQVSKIYNQLKERESMIEAKLKEIELKESILNIKKKELEENLIKNIFSEFILLPKVAEKKDLKNFMIECIINSNDLTNINNPNETVCKEFINLIQEKMNLINELISNEDEYIVYYGSNLEYGPGNHTGQTLITNFGKIFISVEIKEIFKKEYKYINFNTNISNLLILNLLKSATKCIYTQNNNSEYVFEGFVLDDIIRLSNNK